MVRCGGKVKSSHVLILLRKPHRLMSRGRYVQAYQSLLAHNWTSLQAARELYYAHCLIEIEKKSIGSGSWTRRLIELFTIPRVRRATLAGFVVMLAQQVSSRDLSLAD